MLDINEISECDVAADLADLLDGASVEEIEYAADQKDGRDTEFTVTASIGGESRTFLVTVCPLR